MRVLESGGLLDVRLPEDVPVVGKAFDGTERNVRIFVKQGADVGALAPRLDVAGNYSVAGMKEHDDAKLKPYHEGMTVDLTHPVQYVLKSGGAAETVNWTVTVRHLERAAVRGVDTTADNGQPQQ